MAYTLRVTRRDPETDVGADIALDEWRSVVAGDPSLAFHDGVLRATNPITGEEITMTSPDGVHWSSEDGEVPLQFHRGTIRVDLRGGSDAVIAKLVEIAALLGAFVVGDEGERYGTDA